MNETNCFINSMTERNPYSFPLQSAGLFVEGFELEPLM